MKLYDYKRIAVIFFSIILGLAFSAYLLFEQIGVFGKKEILILTAIIAITISVIIIKKGNK